MRWRPWRKRSVQTRFCRLPSDSTKIRHCTAQFTRMAKGRQRSAFLRCSAAISACEKGKAWESALPPTAGLHHIAALCCLHLSMFLQAQNFPQAEMAQTLSAHGHRSTAFCCILGSGILALFVFPHLRASWQWAEAIHRVGLRQLLFHFRRIRRVRSCSACARAILPNEWYKACGCCDFLICSQCSRGQDSSCHEHVLHHEIQPLVVDTTPLSAAKSAGQALAISFNLYANRPCLGWRTGTSYTWHSYHEAGQMAASFASSLKMILQQIPEQPGKQSAHIVGLLSAVSVPWFIADFACSLVAIPLVIMHRATDAIALAHILDTTGLCVLMASKHLLPVIHQASVRASASQLRAIVWIDDTAESYCLQASSRPLTAEEASQVASSGWQQRNFHEELLREGPHSALTMAAAFREPRRVAKLLPSSGSTGLPKLAVVTEEALFKDSVARKLESPQG